MTRLKIHFGERNWQPATYGPLCVSNFGGVYAAGYKEIVDSVSPNQRQPRIAFDAIA
jgi:hypothetical protein